MTWIRTNSQRPLPKNPVIAGNDLDGSPIYVGRAWHDGELFPGKIFPASKTCFIIANGRQIVKENFDILTGKGFTWITAQNGELPDGVVPGGKLKDGRIVYIGRFSYEGSTTTGIINPSDPVIFIPFDQREVQSIKYEVLVKCEHNTGCGCVCQ